MKKCLIFIGVLASLFFSTSDASACGRGRFFGRSCGFNSFGCSSFSGGCCTTSCSPVVSVCDPVVSVCDPVATIVPVQTAFAYPILVPASQFQYVPPTYAAPTVPVVNATAFPGYAGAYPAYPPQPIAYGTPGGYTPASYGYPGYPPQGMAPPQYGQQPYGYPPQSMPPQGYGPPQYGAPPQQNNDRIRELAKALLEEMNRQANNPQDSGPPPVPGLGQPSNPEYNIQQPPPPIQQPPQPQPQQLQQAALSALSRNCYACHTGVGAEKGYQIFTQPGLVNSNLNWRKAREEIVREDMPPKKSQFRFTPQEKAAVLQWFSSIGVN
jgi:hypothetical protein